IVLVTSNESSNINKYAHITLFTSRVNKTDSIGEISGQIPLLIIIDLIYSQYINMYKENISKWIHTEHAYLHGHDTQYESILGGENMECEYQFPEGFLWGAASSATQSEGAANEGGKGKNI